MKVDHDWLPFDLPPNVELDESVYLHSVHAFLHYRSVRQRGVRVGMHTALYDTTMFDLGPEGSVEIGAYGVLYGPHFIANSPIVVGDYVYLSYEVYIADDMSPVPPVDPAYRPRPVPHGKPSIVIGDDCWVGLRSAVLAGAILGQGVIVGAGSVVDFEVPPYSIVAGNPARIVGSAPPGCGSQRPPA